jgi:hypothetical protein
MTRTGLATVVVFMALLCGTQAAFALSTQAGDNVQGAYVNLADPDDQMPSILKPVGSQQSSSSAKGFDDNFSGQGFVNQDAVARSMARGSGSFIQPEQQK